MFIYLVISYPIQIKTACSPKNTEGRNARCSRGGGVIMEDREKAQTERIIPVAIARGRERGYLSELSKIRRPQTRRRS